MKYILQKWLQEILGIVIEMEKLDSYMRDGTIFVQILQHYSAINLNTVDIQPSTDNIVRRINLIQLKAWFKLLNIDFNNEIIEDILGGKISTCINILYQLYLCFENKTSLLIIPKQKERLIKKSDKKYKVTDFSLSDLQQNNPNDRKEKVYKYSDRFFEHKDVIGWYKDKYVPKKNKRSIKTTLLPVNDNTNKLMVKDSKFTSKKKLRFEEDIYYVRNELDRFYSLNNSYVYNADNNGVHGSCVVFGDEFTSSKFNKTTKLNKCKPDSSFNNRGHFLPPISFKDRQSASSTCAGTKDKEDNYLEKLECRIQSSFKKRKMSKEMCDYMMNDVWCMILDKEEDDLKEIIGRKLIKQSLFEKVWLMRLFQIMNQSEVQKQSYSKLKCHLERKSDLNIHPTDYESPKISNDDDDVDDDDDDDDNDEDCNLLLFRDYVLYYHNERKRTVELHRRLYAEKLKLAFEKHYALCLQTVEDIVDVSIKISEFNEKYDMTITERLYSQWKLLFYHGLPVYMCDHNLFLKDHEYDKRDSYECHGQNILNAGDLDDYLHIEHEWKHVFELGDTVVPHGFSENSENLLLIGYIVHKLLQFKYPCLPPPKPADIPKYPIRVILNDMNDKQALMNFRNLLTKAEILVVDVNSAVNFCLTSYKNEMGLELNDFSDKKYPQYSSNRASFRSVSDSRKSKEPDDKFKEQSTQTSQSSINLKDSFLSENAAAKLGKELFNAMLYSNELSTTLIVDVIIEYIKNNQDNIKGWVLVNFPSNLFQASVLENALSGKRFPYFFEDEDASRLSSDIGPLSDVKRSGSYIGITVQSSRIVPNPKECDGKDVFKTYFSKYFTTIKGEAKLSSSTDEFPPGEENNSMHSESTLLLEHPEKEGVPTINEFYRDQGISYELVYEKYDLNVLKQLARLILLLVDEDSIQIPSADLFGKDMLNKLMSIDEAITGRTDSPLTKPGENLFSPSVTRSSGILSYDGRSSLASSETFDKVETFSKPGDKNWVYASDPIPENLAFSLASFWESLEAAYLSDLKNVFYLKRNTDYDLIPYIHYTTKIMKSCLNLKDYRQNIVTEFLNNFNGVHMVLRSDEDMKVELHLRINELRENLIKLCDNERVYSERIRSTIINQNWTYLQMAAICNCFISMLQIEADRCTRVLQFLKDYYYAMLGLFKVEPISDDFPKLSKVMLCKEENEENAVSSKIIQSLVNPEWSSTSLTNPVYEVFEKKAAVVCSAIEDIKSVLDNVIAVEETNALKTHKDLSNVKEQELQELEKKHRQSKDFKRRKSRSNLEDSLKEINEAKLNLSHEIEKKEQSIKNFFLEWSTAVKVEVERTLFRIGLIKRKAFIDLMEIEISMSQTFNHFYDLILSKFERECVCIDQLCLLFHLAVEEKTPVHGDIHFHKDRLFVSKRDIEKTETILKLPPGLEEMLFEESFTIKQLEEMKNRLMYVAPNGLISQEAFVTLIETMIIEGTSHGSIKLVPNIWQKLKSDEFSILFLKVFGNSGVIPWRDFLIYCLDVPYPVTEDIIDAKLQFLYRDPQVTETVSYEDYMNITLWFHRELPESPLQALHNVLAKEFLFSLYKVGNESIINYMALLMAFCRDEDVKIGFGKGLSLLYGRCVIVFEEDLYLEKILTDHVHTGKKIVNHILDEVIEDIVFTASGIMEISESDLRYREQPMVDLGLKDSQFSLDVESDMNDFYPHLTEYMYDQFFRRHKTLRWTSKVPFVVIVTLMAVAFYPVFVPHYAHEHYSNVFEKVRSHMTNLQESGEDFVYAPLFLENDWFKSILQNIPKFRALSFTNVIKEIVSARNLY